MSEFDTRLIKAISNALLVCEADSSLVITSTVISDIAQVVADKVKLEYAGGVISPDEMNGVSSLVFNAIADKKFFDWEMPTLTGYTAEEFGEIAHKLRKSVDITS